MKDIIYVDFDTDKEFSGYEYYRNFWKEAWMSELGESEIGREKFNPSRKDVIDAMIPFFEECDWCEKVREVK